MSSLSTPIADRALQILASQPFVPMSPCETENSGRLFYCAAAAVAKAALELQASPASVRAFDLKLTTDRSGNVLEDAFEEVGLPRALCTRLRGDNDQIGLSERKWRMEATIRALRAPQR